MNRCTWCQYRDDSAWFNPFLMVILITLVSMLPYVDRGNAQLLGTWVLIAPGLGLLITVFLILELSVSLYWLDDDYFSYRKHSYRIALIFMFPLLIASALNLWVVAIIWVSATSAATVLVPEIKQASLSEFTQQDDISNVFEGAAAVKTQTVVDNLKYLDGTIKSIISNIACKHESDSGNNNFASKFVCDGHIGGEQNVPMCQFVWKVEPVFSPGTKLATVESREDVVSKFSTSGYGKFGLSGGEHIDAPYVGVAFVACDIRNADQSSVFSESNLRVAFVLSNLEGIKKYDSLFRTVGFDWVKSQYFDQPYLAELFALASLYRISLLLSEGDAPFEQTMTSNQHHDLFGINELIAFREIDANNIRIGNNSDGQLGNSRGSCILAAAVYGVTGTNGIKLHVSPSKVTSVLPTADRSLVLMRKNIAPDSIPCTLLSALVTRNMGSVSNYPPALTGTTVRYHLVPGESERDAMRRGFNVRAAGLTLHLLGFSVTYDDKRLDKISGFWPRDDLLH